MAFRFLNQELAIDLGTANTVIFQNDQTEGNTEGPGTASSEPLLPS